ncbi:hypothetical protein TWF694_008345 [Orbilia ellipsospora]|uniref:Uncharacterized protein n=1 Tax=Orbilia ellipsospora TaxID=2528407 RepID=A0AAV9WUV6_9PEZI
MSQSSLGDRIHPLTATSLRELEKLEKSGFIFPRPSDVSGIKKLKSKVFARDPRALVAWLEQREANPTIPSPSPAPIVFPPPESLLPLTITDTHPENSTLRRDAQQVEDVVISGFENDVLDSRQLVRSRPSSPTQVGYEITGPSENIAMPNNATPAFAQPQPPNHSAPSSLTLSPEAQEMFQFFFKSYLRCSTLPEINATADVNVLAASWAGAKKDFDSKRYYQLRRRKRFRPIVN